MAAIKMTFDELAQRYCKLQENSPRGLLAILKKQFTETYPDVTGWFLAECVQLDASRLGSLVIVAYGPSNTFKEVPTSPFSPRGLASDMSVAVGYCLRSELPDKAADWTPPPPPPEPTKGKRKR